MSAKIQSEWMGTCVEILKILHGFEYQGFNEDLDVQEYVNLDKSKIMVVLTDENGRSCNIETKKARMIQELSETDRYKKIVVVAESQTKSAHNILMHNKKVDIITSNARVSFKSSEILSALAIKYETLCAELRGNVLVNAKNFYKNAEFHARMGWYDQLFNDFTQLIKLQTEIQVDPPHLDSIDYSDNS